MISILQSVLVLDLLYRYKIALYTYYFNFIQCLLLLLDAFAKVIFTHFIAETRVIWETRSPTWDQTIIFEDIYLWGDVNEIAVNPPTIVVEIFDKDIGVCIFALYCSPVQHVGPTLSNSTL